MPNSAKPIIAWSLCALAVCTAIVVWHIRVNSIASAIGEVPETTPGDNESYADKLARYRAGADAAARAACTNEVTGLRGIINLDTDTTDNNFTKWTATATVEYINQIGGVDRTNLAFRFDPGFTGQPTWFHQ
jgi:hypothetical protein